MRVVSYGSERGVRAGVIRAGEILDAWELLEEEPTLPTVRHLLERGLLDTLAGVMQDPPDAAAPTGAWLEPPVPNPDKIICIGLNYRSHAEEAGLDPPGAPTFFAKFRNALVPSGAQVRLPEASGKVDYEAEMAFVIGRQGKEVPEEDALSFVAGYTLVNDLSARDLQFATPQWMPGKVFDGSAPCGPALVTPDEAGPHDAIEISLELNGQTMQSASTDDLIFSVPALVAHLSSLMTLEPGDIVSTGTPSGVGSVREPRVWLNDGDEVVVSSPTLGSLETTIRR